MIIELLNRYVLNAVLLFSHLFSSVPWLPLDKLKNKSEQTETQYFVMIIKFTFSLLKGGNIGDVS